MEGVKKQTNPNLLVSFQEADRSIEQQILNGKNISLGFGINLNIENSIEQFKNWDQFNLTLLNGIFDNTVIVNEYNTNREQILLIDYYKIQTKLDEKVSYLINLKSRLHLYKISLPTSDTLYDKMIKWFKNNKLTAIILLITTIITGITPFIQGTLQLKSVACYVIGCRDSTQYQIKNLNIQNPICNMFKEVFSNINVGDTYDSTLGIIDKDFKTSPYLSNPTASECFEKDVLYSWKFLKDFQLGKQIFHTLNNYQILQLTDTSWDQLILLYKNKILVKATLRVGNRTHIISDYLKTQFKLNFDDNTGYYYLNNDDVYFVHITPNKKYEIIDFEKVKRNNYKFCSSDWNYNLKFK